MSEYKTNDSNLGEVLYGSVVGVGKLAGDFLKGALILPISSLTIPTTVRQIRDQFKEANETGGESPASIESLKEYLSNTPLEGIGALTTGILIWPFADEAYHFVSEHPYILAVPVATNLLSAGYEKYRKDKEKRLKDNKEKRLEDKLE